eukprot:2648426-Lingulodinium_polyedra.AAC.1
MATSICSTAWHTTRDVLSTKIAWHIAWERAKQTVNRRGAGNVYTARRVDVAWKNIRRPLCVGSL